MKYIHDERKYYFDIRVDYWDIFYQERGYEKTVYSEVYQLFVWAINDDIAIEKAKFEARERCRRDMKIDLDEYNMEIIVGDYYITTDDAML